MKRSTYLRLLILAIIIVSQGARGDAPQIWGPYGAQQLNSGNILAADGSVYPKFTEKNYVASGAWSVGTNPAWIGTASTCTTVTTGLPNAAAGTAMQISGSSGYCGYTFTLDPADYGKKLKVQFDQVPVSYVGAGYVAVVSCTVPWVSNACSGTLTQLPLSTDSAGTTTIPNLTGTFRTTFDAPGAAAPYIHVRIGTGGGGTTRTLNVAGVVVGPGVVTQGAAASTDVSWTPTVSGFGTVTGITASYSTVGENMFGKVQFTAGTTVASLGSITLPNGWTTSDGLNNGGLQFTVGAWQRLVTSATAVKTGVIQTANTASNLLYFGKNDYTGTDNPNTHLNGSSVLGTGDLIEFNFRVRIDQLIGSGTVNVAQNDVEYAYNTSTSTTATDSTSFGYGPSGALIQNITATLNRTVRFPTPIQQGDRISIQVSSNQIDWFDVIGLVQPGNAALLSQYTIQNNGSNVYYGIGAINNPNGNYTDVVVAFGQYAWPSGASYGAAGATWAASSSGSVYWRVKKERAGAAIGFSPYVPGQSSGLVPAAGMPGNTSGGTPSTGGIGEVILSTSSSLSISSTTSNALSITLTPGTWDISALVSANGTAVAANVEFAVNTTSANFTGANVGSTLSYLAVSAQNGVGGGSINPFRVTITTNTVYYLVVQSSPNFASSTSGATLRAIRVY